MELNNLIIPSLCKIHSCFLFVCYYSEAKRNPLDTTTGAKSNSTTSLSEEMSSSVNTTGFATVIKTTALGCGVVAFLLHRWLKNYN